MSTLNLTAKLDKPIVMVGMMASGKSRLGRELASALNIPFIDIDKRIEADAGMSVSEIFKTEGEPAFRDREAKMIADILADNSEACVVSTGGGAIMRPESAALIFGDTISIWLKASIETIRERASRRRDRPLLQNVDQDKVLRDLAEKRYPVYGRATFTVETDHGDVKRALDDILGKLKPLSP
jgi:shikimate kinase